MLFYNIVLLTDVIEPDGAVNVGLLQSYLEQIPEKVFQLGMKVILALLVFYIGMKLIKLFRKLMKKTLIKRSAELGAIQFMDSLLKIGLTILLVLAIASKFGLEATSIITVIGSAGIAVGLALQGSLSNLAGGFLILLLKPFKVGDYIKEDTHGNEGTVTEISIFYTRLTTYDGMTVVLPNGTLANTSLTNVTGREQRKIDIKVSVAYNTDIKKARECITKLLKKEEKIIQAEEKRVFVHELADSSVVLGVRCFVKTENYWDVRWKLNEDIKNTLAENGIKIPFPQMDVHMKNTQEV